MASWQAQDAKARFNEILDASIKDGPQVIVRDGSETAVLVSMKEWKRHQPTSRPSLKELLLAPEARFDNLVPERRNWRRRLV